jgi:geranylgeranyl diphosphate synthase, type II
MSTSESGHSDFDIELVDKKRSVDTMLEHLLAEERQIEPTLMQAMRYTIEGPGKRIRAALLMWCCQAVSGIVNDNARIAAAAVEMVHTCSLVHDDLPAMDNDDMRRGKPTCHKKFDEATAILAGDALLTYAFEVLSRRIDNPATAVALIGELAKAAGPAGMIAGQIADLKAQKTKDKSASGELEYIHTNKTAKMFRAAAAMGAICGDADREQYESLGEYGLKVGLCFQITDDILDVSSSSEQLGKTAGKDAKADKVTYPLVFGLEKSRELARQLAQQALDKLESFGSEAVFLRQLAIELLGRKK